MPHFLVEYQDLGQAQIREERRPEHVAYRKGLGAALLLAGPILDDSERAIGSLVILDVADLVAAQDIAARDPYVVHGAMRVCSVRRYRVAAMQPPRSASG